MSQLSLWIDGCKPRSDNHATRPTSASPATAIQATIDKSLEVNGDVIGSESLYIDGKVKGTIKLSGSRVTIGRNGLVSGNICP